MYYVYQTLKFHIYNDDSIFSFYHGNSAVINCGDSFMADDATITALFSWSVLDHGEPIIAPSRCGDSHVYNTLLSVTAYRHSQTLMVLTLLPWTHN